MDRFVQIPFDEIVAGKSSATNVVIPIPRGMAKFRVMGAKATLSATYGATKAINLYHKASSVALASTSAASSGGTKVATGSTPASSAVAGVDVNINMVTSSSAQDTIFNVNSSDQLVLNLAATGVSSGKLRGVVLVDTTGLTTGD